MPCYETLAAPVSPILIDPNQILLGGAVGIMWHPFAPRAEDVRHEHFAALSRIPRWGGGTRVPYSVAEHSVRCALYCEKRGASRAVVFQALVHDLHEIYPPFDVPGPMLRGDHPYAVALREMERGARLALRTALGLPDRLDPMVREADMALLAHERASLMPVGFDEHFAGLPVPEEETIEPWTCAKAEAIFLRMYTDLGGAKV
jgi:hypothetical protein